MGENLLQLTKLVVAAYVSKNPVRPQGLPDLIADVSQALTQLSQPAAATPKKPVPAVNPKRSVFPDYIISLEDGRKFKSLRHHLMSTYGMTPDEYRAKWDLPSDYPMVAPNYSAARSAWAKRTGLGLKAKSVVAARKKAASSKTSQRR